MRKKRFLECDIVVYKAYFVSSLEQRTAGCSAAEGSWNTLSQCHDAAAVTTCHVSHVSTYPMVAWAGHRSGHAEKLQLWRILSGLAHSVTRCCHVCACGQLVTCHVSPWRGWSSITVSSPGHPRSCWHMWSLARLLPVLCHHPASSLRSAAGEAGTGQLEAAAAACVWQLGSPPADASCGTGDYWHGRLYCRSTLPPRPGPPPSTAQLLPQLAASLEPRTHRHPAAASQHLASGPLVQGSCAPA